LKTFQDVLEALGILVLGDIVGVKLVSKAKDDLLVAKLKRLATLFRVW
jgi:hypothetical protein